MPLARSRLGAGIVAAMVASSGFVPGGLRALASGRVPRGRVPHPARLLRAASCGAAPEDLAPLPVTAVGEGPEVLFFVHGWPDDEHLWDAQVAHLQGQYRCLRVTMPHFAGRAQAEALGHRPEGYDYVENGAILAATIRAACPGEAVTLVLHDWGCLWGFLAMAELPGLVKAVVAMDVGPLSHFLSGWGKLGMVAVAGIAYQYWLLAAYLLNRASGTGAWGSPGRTMADSMAKIFLGLAWKNQNKKAELEGDRITAAACYPYYYFQRAWGVRGVGQALAPGQPEPPCPCLFLYGRKKPFPFHPASWVKHLEERKDCKVVGLDAGHWLQVERPEEVNAIMESWLAQTLQPVPSSRL